MEKCNFLLSISVDSLGLVYCFEVFVVILLFELLVIWNFFDGLCNNVL